MPLKIVAGGVDSTCRGLLVPPEFPTVADDAVLPPTCDLFRRGLGNGYLLESLAYCSFFFPGTPHYQLIPARHLTRTKPDPEPYERAVHRSGASPERVVAIEDSERGLTSAMAAGIGCIIVPTDFTRTCAFAGARAIVTSVIDILALL